MPVTDQRSESATGSQRSGAGLEAQAAGLLAMADGLDRGPRGVGGAEVTLLADGDGQGRKCGPLLGGNFQHFQARFSEMLRSEAPRYNLNLIGRAFPPADFFRLSSRLVCPL